MEAFGILAGIALLFVGFGIMVNGGITITIKKK